MGVSGWLGNLSWRNVVDRPSKIEVLDMLGWITITLKVDVTLATDMRQFSVTANSMWIRWCQGGPVMRGWRGSDLL